MKRREFVKRLSALPFISVIFGKEKKSEAKTNFNNTIKEWWEDYANYSIGTLQSFNHPVGTFTKNSIKKGTMRIVWTLEFNIIEFDASFIVAVDFKGLAWEHHPLHIDDWILIDYQLLDPHIKIDNRFQVFNIGVSKRDRNCVTIRAIRTGGKEWQERIENYAESVKT